MTQHANATPIPGRGFKPLDSLLRHTRLMILVFLGVVMLGVVLAFILSKPLYQTIAVIQVSPRYMKTLRDDIELEFQSNTQYLQFIEQQMRTINRYDVLELAMQKIDALGLEQNPWQREGEPLREGIERLQRSLQISAVRDSYLVQVKLEGEQAEGLELIVNTVVEAYLERSREEAIFAKDERVATLQEREAELLQRIEEMTGERSDIARELGVTAFNPAEKNPYDIRMQQLQTEQATLRLQRLEAETRLDSFLESGETDLAMESIQDGILADPGLNSLKASLNQRRAILVSTVAGLSSDHPAYLDAQDELRIIEAEITRRESLLREELRGGFESRYRNSFQQAREIETQLDAMIADLTADGAAYSQGYNRAISINNHLNLMWQELDRVRDRLNFFVAEESSPGFVHMVTPARPPLLPTAIGKKKILLLAIVAAAAAALALPLLLDAIDNRIRTVNDVHRILGFSPLGWVVDTFGRQSERFAEDQIRRIASGMIRDADKHGTRSVVITSVKPGGGTTYLVHALVRCLNQLGFGALAIEANAFRCDTSYGSGPGLVTLLDQPQEHALLNETDALLPCLPVGPVAEQSALQNLQGLGTVLSALPERFRFLILDAPPLLTSSDAELIARATDGMILVVEAGSTTNGELQRAGRLLQNIDPAVVGTVVNRVAPFRSGGYVDLLMDEHESGRKTAGFSPWLALKDAVHALTWDALAMLLHVIHLPLGLFKRRANMQAITDPAARP